MKRQHRLLFSQLLIIAVVLVMVAKLNIPRFSSASTEAKISSLIDSLEAIRRNIDLYRAWNDDRFPPAKSLSAFIKAITKKSGQFKPSIKRIPVNPFNGLNTIRFDGEPAGNGQAGWHFDTKTGVFQADNGPGYVAL